MPGDVQMPDYEVVIDGQSYSAIAVPAADSGVVIAERDRLLKDLKLESLNSSLRRAGELLTLAYNAVAGFGDLRGAVTADSDRLMMLTNECEVTMQRFGVSARSITGSLKDCFKFLMGGHEEMAIHWLNKVGHTVSLMPDEGYALAVRFETLGNDALQTLARTQKVPGKTEELVKQNEELQQALRLNALFLRRMSDYCKELTQSDLKEKIEVYKGFSDRLSHYREPDFKEEFVRYMAAWKAIEVIAASCTYPPPEPLAS